MKSNLKKYISSFNEDDLCENSIHTLIANIVDDSSKKRIDIFNSFNEVRKKRGYQTWKHESMISDLKSGRMKLPLDAIVTFFMACGLKSADVRKASCIVLKAYMPDDLSCFIKTPFLNDNNEIIQRFSRDSFLTQQSQERKYERFSKAYTKELIRHRTKEISSGKGATAKLCPRRIEDKYVELWSERHCVFLQRESKEQLNTLEIISENPDDASILLIPFDNFSDTTRNSKIKLIRNSNNSLNALSVYHNLVLNSDTTYETVPPYVMLLRFVELYSEKCGLDVYTFSNQLIGSLPSGTESKFLGDIERIFYEPKMVFVSDVERDSFISFSLSMIKRARALGSTMFSSIDNKDKIMERLKELNMHFYRYSQHRPAYEFSYRKSVNKSYPTLQYNKARLFALKLKLIFSFESKTRDFSLKYRKLFTASLDNQAITEDMDAKFNMQVDKINLGFNGLFWNSDIEEIDRLVNDVLTKQ